MGTTFRTGLSARSTLKRGAVGSQLFATLNHPQRLNAGHKKSSDTGTRRSTGEAPPATCGAGTQPGRRSSSAGG